MAFGRNKKCVTTTSSPNPKKVVPHNEFISRIRKSLYFGAGTHTERIKVSHPLAEYASDLFSAPYKGHTIKRLYIGDLPSFCIHAPPCSLLMALIYLDRLSVLDPCYMRRITPQELFVVSMMISTKFYAGHDEEFYLSDWAQDGEISEERLKKLELEFLCAIDWNIYISNDQFFNKLSTIEETLARREGLKRGWLTYTELVQLLPSFTLAKFILQNIAVLAVSYVAGVMTIAGAFFLASHIPGNALHRETLEALRRTGAADTALPVNETLPLAHEYSDSNNITRNVPMAIEIAIAHNHTCNALNVQAELLKLEGEYREEAQRENLRGRQNEIESNSRLNLPTNAKCVVQPKNGNRESDAQLHDRQRNWLTLKEEYSDGIMERAKYLTIDDHVIPYQDGNEAKYIDSTSNCFVNYGNCTGFMFWKLLADAARQSLVRSPTLFGYHIPTLAKFFGSIFPPQV